MKKSHIIWIVLLSLFTSITNSLLAMQKQRALAKAVKQQTPSSLLYAGVKLYYQGKYPTNHWALQPLTLSDPKVVALTRYKNSEYAIYMNPTDKRGYRSIVRFINNGDMASTFNRTYTSQEKKGLHLSMQLMQEAYDAIVPITQVAITGNNAHNFHLETGITLMRHKDEPSFLHGHIFGRGDPKISYIDDVPLDGPNPGKYFDMMAKQPLEAGNDKKISWKDEQLVKVVARFKCEIAKMKDKYPEVDLLIGGLK